MSGTAISSNGGAGKKGNETFVKGSRGSLIYLVRSDVAQALADKDGGLMPMTGDSFGRIPVKDVQIAELLEKFGAVDVTNQLLGTNLPELLKAILGIQTTGIVSCPLVPITIPGIGAGAEGALDAMGTQFTLAVPKRGVLISAMYYDPDFEGTQVNIYLFNRKVTAIADNAAWTLSDGDAPHLIKKLAFFSFDVHSNTCYTSEINNIGKAYTAPHGKLWIQASCVLTPTIAVAPKFQLQIQSFDPEFKES